MMIRHFVDTSSGHLSPETWDWLDTQLADDVLRDPTADGAALIAGGKTRYGWLVYAPEDPTPEMPLDLQLVCAYARTHGAEYVLFDCDAPFNTELSILHPDFSDD
jgi:hypothetical protein